MKQPSQEDLVGFVLGALDATEQNQIQDMIDNDPHLEEQVVELKNSLMPLEAINNPVGPPVGLARRTCEFVAQSIKTEELEEDRVATLSPKPAPLQNSSWSLMDILVTCGVFLVVAAILFPALAMSRYNSRLVACQGNLSSLGNAFLSYSEGFEGEFPEIPVDGNLAVAGSYAPFLKAAGLIEDDTVFACAGRVGEREAPVSIPTVDMINEASCDAQLHHYRQTMGGDYGYSLGYSENGNYHPAKRLGRTHFVLLADMPSCNNAQRVSGNHGGHGQNALFEDGHVEWIRGAAIGEDAVFENNFGLVAPGSDRFDSVVAPSWVTPVVFTK